MANSMSECWHVSNSECWHVSMSCQPVRCSGAQVPRQFTLLIIQIQDRFWCTQDPKSDPRYILLYPGPQVPSCPCSLHPQKVGFNIDCVVPRCPGAKEPRWVQVQLQLQLEVQVSSSFCWNVRMLACQHVRMLACQHVRCSGAQAVYIINK